MGSAKWKRGIGHDSGKGYRPFMPFLGTPPSQHLDIFITLEAFHALLFKFFMESD
jgi:hypothetical protein